MSWDESDVGHWPCDAGSWCAGAGNKGRAARLRYPIGLSALLTLAGSVPAIAEGAHGTIYSIHMIAKIPSICSLGGLSRTITLDGITDDVRSIGPQTGASDFRIRCNVPYALDVGTARNGRSRGRMVPLSATFDPPAELIAAARPADEPAPFTESSLLPSCILQPHGAAAVACPDIAAINDGAGVAPSSGGRISVNAVLGDSVARYTQLAFLSPLEAPDSSMQETAIKYDVTRAAATPHRAPIVVTISGRL